VAVYLVSISTACALRWVVWLRGGGTAPVKEQNDPMVHDKQEQDLELSSYTDSTTASSRSSEPGTPGAISDEEGELEV